MFKPVLSCFHLLAPGILAHFLQELGLSSQAQRTGNTEAA